MTEALALKRALMITIDLGLDKVCFESDSLLLVNEVSSHSTQSHDWRCRHIIHEIVGLLSSSVEFSVCFTPHTGNAAADCIAAEVYKGVYPIGWVASPSLSLLSILTEDTEKSITQNSSPPSSARLGIG